MKSIITKFGFAILFAFMSLFAVNTAFAQVPDAINFQAIARDVNGQIMPETDIMIQLSILDGGPAGTQVYREIRSLTTNDYGSFSFQIGREPFMSEGVFADIDWAGGDKFLKVDYDPTASLNFDLTLGTIEFVTVPFAFAARDVVYIDASGAVEGDILVFNGSTGKFEPEQQSTSSIEWDNIQNKPDFATVATSGDYNDLSNTPQIDGSETTIIAGNNVTVTGSGTIEDPYVVNAIGGGTNFTAPTANVLPASNIEPFAAQLNGNVNANGLSTTVVFEWGTTTAYGSIATATQSPVTGTADIAVSVNLTSLQSNTTYHYRIKATNAVNITYSNDMSFVTILSAPQLTTNAISSITGISAVSGGNITYDGGTPVTARGVCWNTNPSPTLSNSFTSDGIGSGTYNSTITGLALGTTYYVRAYATNAVGTTYGNERSFTTVALPLVTTSNFSDVKGNSAKAGGTITSNGGGTITAQGLCWSTSPNPTTANSINTSFTDVMTTLSPNTIYYVRAYATNIAGTGYGNQISFNSGYIIGSTYGGGLVFYNDGSAHGLVCAPSDQSTGAEWGCLGTTIGGTSTAINTGAANTNAIVAGCTTAGIAAKLCFDLTLNSYTDWYLPSRDELNYMYVNLHTQSLGGFASGYYWSSSEDDDLFAWKQNFYGGYQHNYVKNDTYYVRAVRAF